MQRESSSLAIVAIIVLAGVGYADQGRADEWIGDRAAGDFVTEDFSIVDPSVQDEFFFYGRRGRRRSPTIGSVSGIVGGAELVFLTPEYNGGGAGARFRDSSADVTVEVDDEVADLGDFHPTPRVWAGWQNRQGGILGRYWRFANSESFRSTSSQDGMAPWTSAEFHQRFDLYAVDLMWQRAWQPAAARWHLELGIRYVAAEHHQHANLLGEVDDALGWAMSGSVRDFHGVGPVIALGSCQPLDQGGTWQWFWGSRSSAAWGSVDTRVAVRAVATDGVITVVEEGAVQETDDFLFIGEAQLGLQHTWRLDRERLAYLWAAGEYQYWAARRGAAATSVSLDAPGRFQLESSSDAPPLKLSLLGVALGLGIRW